MREEKKRILEDVMEKETYKVAKEILEKFAPDQLRKSPVSWSPFSWLFSTNPVKGRDVLKCSDPDRYPV
jgi:hypothetical protein